MKLLLIDWLSEASLLMQICHQPIRTHVNPVLVIIAALGKEQLVLSHKKSFLLRIPPSRSLSYSTWDELSTQITTIQNEAEQCSVMKDRIEVPGSGFEVQICDLVSRLTFPDLSFRKLPSGSESSDY